MDHERLLEKLLAASEKLLAQRYRDGECDSCALFNFQYVVEEIKETLYSSSYCEHKNIIIEKEDELFYDRRGCLDCNTWFGKKICK